MRFRVWQSCNWTTLGTFLQDMFIVQKLLLHTRDIKLKCSQKQWRLRHNVCDVQQGSEYRTTAII